MQCVIDHQGRRRGAESQAIHGEFLEFSGTARGEATRYMLGKRLAAHALACFSTAYLNDVFGGRRGTKVMVESDYAMDFGAGTIQSERNLKDGLRRHETQ